MMGTIFSPSFHISKHAGGEITNGGRLLELVYQLITFLNTFTSSNINKSTNTANINRPRNIKLQTFSTVLLDIQNTNQNRKKTNWNQNRKKLRSLIFPIVSQQPNLKTNLFFCFVDRRRRLKEHTLSTL